MHRRIFTKECKGGKLQVPVTSCGQASAEAPHLVAYIFRYHVSLEQIYAGRRITGSIAHLYCCSG